MLNKEVFNKVYHVSSWSLVVISIWVIYSGLKIVILTTGYVRGSEFGMQITIVNLLGKMLMWIGLYFFWCWSAKKTYGEN